MKLNVFNPENCRSARGRSRKTRLSFAIKGSFKFNSQAAEVLGTEQGDHVLFHQDEETGCWFVEKVEDGGFELTAYESTKSVLGFHNAHLSKSIAQSYSFTGTYGSFELAEPVEHDGRTLFELLPDSTISE